MACWELRPYLLLLKYVTEFQREGFWTVNSNAEGLEGALQENGGGVSSFVIFQCKLVSFKAYL